MSTTMPPEPEWDEQDAALERCLVAQFHSDPITRAASLDEAETRPILRPLREQCAAKGCPFCGATAGCYFCHQEAGGNVMDPPERLPQRRIVDERTVNPADPTTLLELACGHSII